MKKEITRATDDLKKVSKQSDDLLKILTLSSENISKQNSSALYGILGALIGTLAGLILCVYQPVLGKLVVTTILTALGLVAGVILYRGPRRVPLERTIDERKLHNDGLLLEIQQLPKSAPQDVRDRLWRSYIENNQIIDDNIKLLMLDKNNGYSKILAEYYHCKTIAEIKTPMSSTIKLEECQANIASK